MKRKSKRSKSTISTGQYTTLLRDVSQLHEEARHAAARTVNTILTATYWEIGRRIVEHEQQGGRRAAYGSELLRRLARDLTTRFGRGFGLSNLKQIRKFYLTYSNRGKGQTVFDLLGAPAKNKKGQTASDFLPSDQSHSGTIPISQTPSGKSTMALSPEISETLPRRFPLSWSHCVRLISLDEPDKRDFYEGEARRGGWSVRQLDRQINSMLYERVALSHQKGRLLTEATKTTDELAPEQQIKDPYILEFLGLPELHSESDLENALIERLADFLLELGFGFTFVARQKRFQIGGESYYLDLLFLISAWEHKWPGAWLAASPGGSVLAMKRAWQEHAVRQLAGALAGASVLPASSLDSGKTPTLRDSTVFGKLIRRLGSDMRLSLFLVFLFPGRYTSEQIGGTRCFAAARSRFGLLRPSLGSRTSAPSAVKRK